MSFGLSKMKPTVRLWKPVLQVQRRGFSSSSARLDNYAFIGLGQMVRLQHNPIRSRARGTSY